MKPVVIPHPVYQDSVIKRLRQHYSGGIFVIANDDWHLVHKFCYGRTYHTFSKDNLRLFTKTPRDSDKWKIVYKRRTSIERSNKREKIDYWLESGRHRSTKMWYIRIYGIMICQHMDDWFSHQEKSLSDLKTFIFPQTA